MGRWYYSNSIEEFIRESPNSILGYLAENCEFAIEQTQRDAWLQQIEILKTTLVDFSGHIYFEFSIPRMGKRVDVVLLLRHAIFVIEFKVGESDYTSSGLEQVVDYTLDLKNFHRSSHDYFVVPVLIATKAKLRHFSVRKTVHNDNTFEPIATNGENLDQILNEVLVFCDNENAKNPAIQRSTWETGGYCPTPTIIEAAKALYNGHAVAEISRSDAAGQELQQTTDAIVSIINDAKANSYKAACFVTGVPGAGKTLIGLNVATKFTDNNTDVRSVFLSGNGPLVKILQEALARDQVSRLKAKGSPIKKNVALSRVKSFIQNVHHYRDAYLHDRNPPADRVALFDEAQRAWNTEQTSKFMEQKKGRAGFNLSEPEFLLSCMDRHQDWGVVVCLVGGGQEINTGEAGIVEWISALNRSFPDWRVFVSDRLTEYEFGDGKVPNLLDKRAHVHFDQQLHLSVSMRSFRSENVSKLVKQILDLDVEGAQLTVEDVRDKYPIVITRCLEKAKEWLKEKARGSERYGIVVSSQANRLKPLAIDVRLKPDPVHWFLAKRDDVRSSYYLEDVATEFEIQGLELDWVCVTWDADFRFDDNGWLFRSFRGNKWMQVSKSDRQKFMKNAYRVLLTRARQGMVIVVPEGSPTDPTRSPSFYDPTFSYLKKLGLVELV